MTAAGIGLVSQLLDEEPPPPVDCAVYLKVLTELATSNPQVATVVTATRPDGKPALQFGREAKECGAPGPIIDAIVKATTTTIPVTTTTTSRP